MAATVSACGGAVMSRHHAFRISERAPAPFAWLVPRAAPPGWVSRRMPDGAVLSYPADWRRQRSDAGAATAVLLDRRGRIVGYLNATPQQGDERLAGWPAFRIAHDRDEGDRHVRRLAAAASLRFRGGRGSCVVDQYRTSRHEYREIACIVAGRAATTVVVGAAPPWAWTRTAPVLERAISAFTT